MEALIFCLVTVKAFSFIFYSLASLDSIKMCNCRNGKKIVQFFFIVIERIPLRCAIPCCGSMYYLKYFHTIEFVSIERNIEINVAGFSFFFGNEYFICDNSLELCSHKFLSLPQTSPNLI